MHPELSQDPLKRFTQFRDDPWLFLTHCVYTRDEVDLDNPVKQYPANNPNFAYLRFLVLMWMKFKKIAVPKSRRMTASWTFIPLAVWDCIFHKGRYWALVSKKEEDSKELIERALFVFENIPKEMIDPSLLPKLKRGGMQSSPPAMDFEDIGSKLQGFPQGANQLRQRGFSGIFNDECAFWTEAEEAYASAEPTIKGGGRMVMVSSRAIEDKGFFKKICFDQLDAKDTRFPEIPPVPIKRPMEGIDVWTNPNNGFTVIDLHYTANPSKRGDQFRESLKKTLPIRRYRMEYEKSWETFEGRPVYEDFNEFVHTTNIQPKALVGLPLLLGWDSSGLTPAVVIAQLQGERLYVLREIVGDGVGAIRFVPYVASQLKLYYPHIPFDQIISFADPAGQKKNETDEKTYYQYISDAGLKQIRPGAMRWKKRKDSVDEFLTKTIGGVSAIQFYSTDCPILVAGMKGGYRYPDSIATQEPDEIRPVKDVHSHPNDGLQYLCSGLTSYKKSNYNINIKTPNYGFQKSSSEVAQAKGTEYGRKTK